MAPTVGADPERRAVILARDLRTIDGDIPAGTPVRLATDAERAGEAAAIREMIAAGQVTAYHVAGYGVRYLGSQSVTHD